MSFPLQCNPDVAKMFETHGFKVIEYFFALTICQLLVNLVTATQVRESTYFIYACVIPDAILDAVLTRVYFRVPKHKLKEMKVNFYSHKVWLYYLGMYIFGGAFGLGFLWLTDSFAFENKYFVAVFMAVSLLPMKVYTFRETNYLEEMNRVRIEFNKESLELV